MLEDPAVDFAETYHELIGPGFSGGIADLVGTLTTLIPADLLPSLALPDLLGVQINSLIWLPTADETWQGGFVSIDTNGVQPVELTGCSLDGVGCDGGDLRGGARSRTLLGCSADDGLGCDDSACVPVAAAVHRARRAGSSRPRCPGVPDDVWDAATSGRLTRSADDGCAPVGRYPTTSVSNPFSASATCERIHRLAGSLATRSCQARPIPKMWGAPPAKRSVAPEGRLRTSRPAHASW